MSENLPPSPTPPEDNPHGVDPNSDGADQVPGIEPVQAETAQQPQIDVDPGTASVSGLKSVLALGRDKLASIASGVVSRAEDTLETRSQIIKDVREPAANKKEVVMHPFGRPEAAHKNPVDTPTRTRFQRLSKSREARRRAQVTDEKIEIQRQQATIGAPVDEKSRDVRDARAYNPDDKPSERERTKFKGDSDTGEGIARYTQDRSNRRGLNQSKRNHGLRERRIGRRVRRSDRIEAGEDMIGRGLKRIARAGKALGGQNDGRYAGKPPVLGPKEPTRQQRVETWHKIHDVEDDEKFNYNTLQGIRARAATTKLQDERVEQAKRAKGSPLTELEVIDARTLSKSDIAAIEAQAAKDANQIVTDEKKSKESVDQPGKLEAHDRFREKRNEILASLTSAAIDEIAKTLRENGKLGAKESFKGSLPENIKKRLIKEATEKARELIYK